MLPRPLEICRITTVVPQRDRSTASFGSHRHGNGLRSNREIVGRSRLISERFRSAPRTRRRSAGKLLMRQTACARRFLAAMIGGGTWEGAHARHEAAGVRQPAWRRGGDVAGRGAGAAVQQFDDDWVSGGRHSFSSRPIVRSFCTAAARTRLGRGPHLSDRAPLGEGRNERFAEFAAEFVRLKVDIIVASGTANVLAAKQATAAIPIVVAAAGNPIGSGLVASSAQPGGNVTGLSTQAADLAGKRLEFLREVMPGPGRLAIMGNATNPSVVVEMGELNAAARALGLEIAALEIQKTQDIVPAFEALKGRADALYVVVDALVASNWIRINTLALGARLPTMSGGQAYVEMGGLMSYGPNSPALFRRAADYVDKILRGRSRAISPSSNRPSSIWSSTSSRPRRSVSKSLDPARPRRPGD